MELSERVRNSVGGLIKKHRSLLILAGKLNHWRDPGRRKVWRLERELGLTGPEPLIETRQRIIGKPDYHLQRHPASFVLSLRRRSNKVKYDSSCRVEGIDPVPGGR